MRPFPKHIRILLWKRRIRKSSASENAMVLLECLFEVGNDRNPNVLRHFTGKDPVYDIRNTRRLLESSGIRCPAVDQKMIAAYLEYFRKKGYIH